MTDKKPQKSGSKVLQLIIMAGAVGGAAVGAYYVHTHGYLEHLYVSSSQTPQKSKGISQSDLNRIQKITPQEPKEKYGLSEGDIVDVELSQKDVSVTVQAVNDGHKQVLNNLTAQMQNYNDMLASMVEVITSLESKVLTLETQVSQQKNDTQSTKLGGVDRYMSSLMYKYTNGLATLDDFNNIKPFVEDTPLKEHLDAFVEAAGGVGVLYPNQLWVSPEDAPENTRELSWVEQKLQGFIEIRKMGENEPVNPEIATSFAQDVQKLILMGLLDKAAEKLKGKPNYQAVYAHITAYQTQQQAFQNMVDTYMMEK